MREAGVPQFSIDGHRPVRAFDVLGVSFSTELGYTNLLEALDLAGIPLHARDRDETHPIVLAGGHAAFNPEPIAELHRRRRAGRRRAGRARDDRGHPAGQAGRRVREETLLRLARAGGVYVPRFYDVEHLPDGRIARVARTGRTCRSACTSAPSWTWTSGPTPSSRWCRWPRRCTSG
jgi:hypothetical protein